MKKKRKKKVVTELNWSLRLWIYLECLYSTISLAQSLALLLQSCRSSSPAWVVDQLLLRLRDEPDSDGYLVPSCAEIHTFLHWGSYLSLGKVHGSYGDSKSRFELIIYNVMGVAHPFGHALCNAWKWKWKSLTHVQLFATPWTVTCQAPLSMEFTRQEYWSGLPFPSPV